MSKTWLLTIVLGLGGTVAFAKDKGAESRGSSRGASPRSQPTVSAPRSNPAPAPRQAPTARQAPASSSRPAFAVSPRAVPSSKPATAPRANPAPAPSVKAVPSAPVVSNPSRSSGRIESPSRRTETRFSPSIPSKPVAVAPAPATAKSAPVLTKSGGSTVLIPNAKIGSASGPTPVPSNGKIDLGKTLVPASQKQTEHKYSVSKPTLRGSNSSPSLLPTAPRLETNGKIPPFGSPLTSLSKSNPSSSTHDHEHRSNSATRLPSNSIPATQQVRRDRDDHDHDHRHTNDRRDRDRDHDHSHRHGYSSGYRRSSGLSWFIVGSSLFGSQPCRYGYGYGYGAGHFGPSYVYTAPAEVYIPPTIVSPTVSVGSLPVDSVAPPQNQQITPDEFAALPPQRQRELLLQAVNALEEDFARAPNGEDWSRHLQLATIANLVSEGDQAPDATLRARLRSVVQLFDEVAANTDYKAVSELTSFRVLHAGLHEFAAEEIDRSRRQLSLSAAELSKSLDAWTSGERWREYLQLTWLIGTDEEMQIDLEARLIRFEKLLEKFDRVKSDEQFQVVTQPREFGLTHETLRQFTSHLRRLVEEARQAEPQPKGELVIPAAPR